LDQVTLRKQCVLSAAPENRGGSPTFIGATCYRLQSQNGPLEGEMKI